MNLLVVPMPFCVAGIQCFGTSGVTTTALALAWAHVALHVASRAAT